MQATALRGNRAKFGDTHLIKNNNLQYHKIGFIWTIWTAKCYFIRSLYVFESLFISVSVFFIIKNRNALNNYGNNILTISCYSVKACRYYLVSYKIIVKNVRVTLRNIRFYFLKFYFYTLVKAVLLRACYCNMIHSFYFIRTP